MRINDHTIFPSADFVYSGRRIPPPPCGALKGVPLHLTGLAVIATVLVVPVVVLSEMFAKEGTLLMRGTAIATGEGGVGARTKGEARPRTVEETIEIATATELEPRLPHRSKM